MTHMPVAAWRSPWHSSQAPGTTSFRNNNQIEAKPAPLPTTRRLVHGHDQKTCRRVAGGEDRSTTSRARSRRGRSRNGAAHLGKFMEKIYRDKELDYTQGPSPNPQSNQQEVHWCIARAPPPRWLDVPLLPTTY
jgi:penicillin-binding protein 1A